MTPRKEKALQALLVSRTRAEAAQAAQFMQENKNAAAGLVRPHSGICKITY